jgi:hypothetical protein
MGNADHCLPSRASELGLSGAGAAASDRKVLPIDSATSTTAIGTAIDMKSSKAVLNVHCSGVDKGLFMIGDTWLDVTADRLRLM